MPRFMVGPRRSGRNSLWAPRNAAPLVVLAMFSVEFIATEPALARGHRGGGGYIRQMQQMVQAQQVAQQKMIQAIQKQQEAEYKAFMERFDTNRDGKITGKERGPATKYLRELELGVDPDAKLNKQRQATMKLGKKKSSKPSKD